MLTLLNKSISLYLLLLIIITFESIAKALSQTHQSLFPFQKFINKINNNDFWGFLLCKLLLLLGELRGNKMKGERKRMQGRINKLEEVNFLDKNHLIFKSNVNFQYSDI